MNLSTSPWGMTPRRESISLGSQTLESQSPSFPEFFKYYFLCTVYSVFPSGVLYLEHSQLAFDCVVDTRKSPYMSVNPTKEYLINVINCYC